MSDPWEPLEADLFSTLKTSVQDFIDVQKPETIEFLKEKAKFAAKQTWLSVAPTASDDLKEEAKGNLRHLKSQVIMEAADKLILTTAAAAGLLSKVFEVVGNFLIQHGPQILAVAIAAA